MGVLEYIRSVEYSVELDKGKSKLLDFLVLLYVQEKTLNFGANYSQISKFPDPGNLAYSLFSYLGEEQI